MSNTFSHDQFVSPFAWRYGSPAMRRLWSETYKRRTWRRIWLALARAEHAAGIVTDEQVADLAAHVDDVDIDRAHAIEAEIHHDLMAEVRAYAEQCPVGGGIIHLGATSADIEDNADALRIRESLDLILNALRELLSAFANQINQLADVVVMAFTHVQPAEPTTMGYRLALYAQDLLEDYRRIGRLRGGLKGKGLKGAVGTAAAFVELTVGSGISPADLEAIFTEIIGLPAYPIASQVYSRKQDWEVLSALSGLAASLHKFAFDLRLLQSPVIGEWSEPFAAQQVGSSAMPFKRNPINAEKIDSLARLIAAQEHIAWDNAALSLLERTLDDSANRREILPVAFLAADEILRVALRIVTNLHVNRAAAARNLERYGTFAAVERVLMAAVKAGSDRQRLHEILRAHSLAAWAALSSGANNPLPDLLSTDAALLTFLTAEQIRALLDSRAYVGDAPERALRFAQELKTALA
jgi:adenylosuccinate lyase